MALVTDTFDSRFQFNINIWKPFTAQQRSKLARFVTFTCAGLIAGSCMIGAFGVMEAVLPAFVPFAPVMRRLPEAMPRQLGVVNHKIGIDHVIRQRFIEAYTANMPYSNLDWHRNKLDHDANIIADIGAEGIVEEKPAAVAPIIEPRAERVPFTPAAEASPAVTVVPQTAPDRVPLQASAKAAPELFVPEDVPLPSRKPVVAQPRKQEAAKLAYAPATEKTEEPKHEGLLRRLFRSPTAKHAAIYDISAATVYLPNGEKLEAHSGIGPMRDNPRSVTQKNRGATPPHTYNLRMRESLFHGVAAIRLTPVDGRNPHNRDGLLAHTYMLGRNGDSNGCVVFKNYERFLRAFKRGEFDQLIVVEHMNPTPSRVASVL
ncbi:DUF2778 domain-containing protein [Ochrobactrum chromiisoli]|uniref:DUF2778 domain-containing protein n=1 Tax=Ochrobactrum chromiisoli TaxID=2993941 RepID=A0ABT3QMH8_9HYPH|nr:tlde1 domain-containing protein [Ochrobactrum chromiisoli]MCX2696813.1 DUF2778 domain-containing protein [Ochrobactrum chromiisoli]